MQRTNASQSGVTSTANGLLGMEQDLRNECSRLCGRPVWRGAVLQNGLGFGIRRQEATEAFVSLTTVCYYSTPDGKSQLRCQACAMRWRVRRRSWRSNVVDETAIEDTVFALSRLARFCSGSNGLRGSRDRVVPVH